MSDYAVSWDFHYHHYAGLYHLGQYVPSIKDAGEVFFTSPDPRLTIEDPFGPFTQTLPTLSYLFFHQRLGVLPFDSAYNFPMVLFGSFGVGLLFLFAYESLGFRVALFSSLFLAFLPTHFGYLHVNMKDVPNAFAFALSIYTFYRLVRKKRVRDLLFAAFAFAFAFNIKINSVLIPVVCFVWYILIGINIHNRKIEFHVSKTVLFYFLLAPFLALVIWWPFWTDPLKKLLELPHFYSLNTINIPVLLFGQEYTSGVDIPWWYPYLYIGITTPIPILFTFVIGMFICLVRVFFEVIRKIQITSQGIFLLLLLWFFIPILRYFNPTSGAIDGVRHFMEIIYPLCFIAGIGASYLVGKITKIQHGRQFVLGILVIFFGWLSFIAIYYHPYQTSYFNFFIGGIRGANTQFDVDFWGTPQREAMLWLNSNAPKNSSIYILMAQSSAGMYLRKDLRSSMNLRSVSESDYVVILNRPSFWSDDIEPLLSQKKKEGKIAYARNIDGVPLVWIIKK